MLHQKRRVIVGESTFYRFAGPVYIRICSSVMCFPERRNSFFLCKKGAREICVRDAIEHLMKLSLQHTALVVCKRD